jgi:hypothetical protein
MACRRGADRRGCDACTRSGATMSTLATGAAGSIGGKPLLGDLLDTRSLTEAMCGTNRVVHIVAIADLRFGTAHLRKGLGQNTVAIFNVLGAIGADNVKEIAFSWTVRSMLRQRMKSDNCWYEMAKSVLSKGLLKPTRFLLSTRPLPVSLREVSFRLLAR